MTVSNFVIFFVSISSFILAVSTSQVVVSEETRALNLGVVSLSPPREKVSVHKDEKIVLKCSLSNSVVSPPRVPDDPIAINEGGGGGEVLSSVRWFHVNTRDGEKVELKGDEIDILVDENKHTSILTLANSKVNDGDEYVCEEEFSNSDEPKENVVLKIFEMNFYFRVTPFPISYTIVAGDDLKLFCRLSKSTLISDEGLSKLSFQWFVSSEGDLESLSSEGVGVNNESSIVSSNPWITIDELIRERETKMRQKDSNDNLVMKNTIIEPHFKVISLEDQSVLKIEDAIYDDRYLYKCVARVEEDGKVVCESETSTLVRVKDRYAAVYVLIGIVGEVIVLCTIILFCERRKKVDKNMTVGTFVPDCSTSDSQPLDDQFQCPFNDSSLQNADNLRHRK